MKVSFLRNLFILMVVLLIGQFLAGMVINLYEDVPFKVDFATFAYTAQGAGYGVHHYLTLIVLFGAALLLLLSVWKVKNPLLSKLSLIGLVSLIISMLGGTAMVYFEENDIYSLIMATAFISALIVYVAAIIFARKTNTEKSTT